MKNILKHFMYGALNSIIAFLICGILGGLILIPAVLAFVSINFLYLYIITIPTFGGLINAINHIEVK